MRERYWSRSHRCLEGHRPVVTLAYALLDMMSVPAPRLAFAEVRIAVAARIIPPHVRIVTPQEIDRYVNQCLEPTTTTTSVGSVREPPADSDWRRSSWRHSLP
jgi:hypothetical protein